MGRGFGVISTTPPAVIEQLAAAAEHLGYTSFWSNDVPGGDGLEVLAAAAGATTTIRLVTGVLGVDRRTPEEIAHALDRLGLPVDRLTIGLGAGDSARPLGAVRDTVTRLKQSLAVPVIVAATGPKMRALAGEIADGALFNWPSPRTAAAARAVVDDAARNAGRPRPRTAAYVRCALLPQAAAAMDAELGYIDGGGMYAKELSAFGQTARDAIVYGTDAAMLQPGLAAFELVVDEVVVRTITADNEPAGLLELLHACAPPE
ncbi:MAG TPA: LLM class flavin-dependent oxidoreductase [Thermomicrobiales bacterium]|nr:LLM class flavin-dependent oxidoreductase [Chloroflexota bacterium]HQX62026.1 LLM class flavin-dependent oxidoreductase [Thermomicrobiales bacterium]HQZ90569.1 LLM class flavin-dependent oxidoreductase [Thermomicrobiales bacterium]HRA30866.1 LLM class flavin-dependent oxidoreductase [Thermomicrobiales bacterium]